MRREELGRRGERVPRCIREKRRANREGRARGIGGRQQREQQQFDLRPGS